MGGTVDADGTCRVQASSPDYTMNLKFPTDYPDEQAILDYLGQAREGFVKVAENPIARNLPYEMTATAEAARSQRTRSVVLTLFQNVGSAHPSTWYKSFTFDVAQGRPVTFDTLFAPDAKPLDDIFPIVRRELEAQTGLAVFANDGVDPARYRNFSITDDDLTFYFSQGELLPSYAGVTSVTLPRSAIPPLQV